MFFRPASDIVAALQTAVGPMILISAVGLFLLAMTNRLGRAIDRSRALASSEPRTDVLAQLQIMLRRCELLRRGVLLAMASALCAACLVIVLFVVVLLNQNLSALISGLFILCMMSLIASLLYFMRDINLSLAALHAKVETSKL